MTITYATNQWPEWNEHQIDDFELEVDWGQIASWCIDRNIRLERATHRSYQVGVHIQVAGESDRKVWGRGVAVSADNDYEDILGALRDVQTLVDQIIEKANQEVGPIVRENKAQCQEW